MERLICKSCGGSLRKTGPLNFVCDYCGTIHRIEGSDEGQIEDLIEANNQRWIRINRNLEMFYEAINQAAFLRKAVRRPKMGLYLLNGFFVLVLLMLVTSFAKIFLKGSREFGVNDLTPIGLTLGSAVVANGYYVGLILYGRYRIRKQVKQAASALSEVVVVYQQMQERPAIEIINRLHDPKKVVDPVAVEIAREVYDGVKKHFDSE